MHGSFANIGAALDQKCFLYEKPQTSDNSFLAESSVSKHSSDHLARSLRRLFVELDIPNTVYHFNAPFAHSGVGICSL